MALTVFDDHDQTRCGCPTRTAHEDVTRPQRTRSASGGSEKRRCFVHFPLYYPQRIFSDELRRVRRIAHLPSRPYSAAGLAGSRSIGTHVPLRSKGRMVLKIGQKSTSCLHSSCTAKMHGIIAFLISSLRNQSHSLRMTLEDGLPARCEVSIGCPSDRELGSWVCEDSATQETRWTTTRMPDSRYTVESS